MDGLKTGYTEQAGYCLTATAEKSNLRLISVVMGESTIENRSSDTVKLLNYGFNTYKVNLIKEKGATLGKIKIEKGKKEYVEVTLTSDAIELLKKSDKVSDYEFDISTDKVKAPVKKGDIVGSAKIYNKEHELIHEVAITVKENIAKATIWDLFMRSFSSMTTFN